MYRCNDELFSLNTKITQAKVIKLRSKRTFNSDTKSIVCVLQDESGKINEDILSPGFGTIKPLVQENHIINERSIIFEFEPCQHNVVVKDLCAECGANLRKQGGLSGERAQSSRASIPMVHSMPELHVSESVAAEIAQNDEKSLLKMRKLVLLVDLDQTVIHTTTDRVAFKFKNVFRYRLANSSIIYHTRMRPHLKGFFERISKLYELHICTFGNRLYAHQLAALIDPHKKYFAQRILSRDECFNPITKAANLKALFPRGTKLVCIIDDRGDVWNWPENLILVQPYKFFIDSGDINAPITHSTTFQPKCFNIPQSLSSKDQENNTAISSSSIQEKSSEEAKSHLANDSSSNEDFVKSEAESSAKLIAEAIARIESQEDYLDRQDGNYLLALEKILKDIHKKFYSQYDSNLARALASNEVVNTDDEKKYVPNIGQIMTDRRKNILGSKCRVTLSGLTHPNTPPSQSLSGELAIRMGAILHSGLRLPPKFSNTKPDNSRSFSPCSKDQITEDSSNDQDKQESVFKLPEMKKTHYTTHLVACRRDTEKVKNARAYLEHLESGIHGAKPSFNIVNPLWLWACYYRWERISGHHFPLERDFHRGDFEPSAEPSLGSPRYMRRLMKRQNSQRTSSENDSLHSYLVDTEKTVKLDSDLVKSALESIQAEISAEKREKNQRKRSTKNCSNSSFCEKPKLLSNSSESESLSSYSSSKQMTSDSSSNENSASKIKLRKIMDPLPEPEDLKEKLKTYLPKEHSLILADNPLMHMPPQLPVEMVNEIEDAVFEEQKMVCASHPPEAEVYDPVTFDLDIATTSASENLSTNNSLLDSSSDSELFKAVVSKRPRIEKDSSQNWDSICMKKKDVHANKDDQDSRRRIRHSIKQREQACRKRLIRIELLMRRRTRASPKELKRINSRIRRIQRSQHSKTRCRRASSVPRRIHSLSKDDENISSSEEVSSLDLSSSNSSFSNEEITARSNSIFKSSKRKAISAIIASNVSYESKLNNDKPQDSYHLDQNSQNFEGWQAGQDKSYSFSSPHIHSDPGGFFRSVSSECEDIFSPRPSDEDIHLHQEDESKKVFTDSSSGTSNHSSSDEEIVDEYLKNLL